MIDNAIQWAAKAICELEEARKEFQYIIKDYNTDSVEEYLRPYERLKEAERLMNYIIMQTLNIERIEEKS